MLRLGFLFLAPHVFVKLVMRKPKLLSQLIFFLLDLPKEQLDLLQVLIYAPIVDALGLFH
jgi:hypothetical protein